MKDLEHTQYFDGDALPNAAPLDAGENSSNDEGDEYVVGVGEAYNKNSTPTVRIYIP